MPAVVTFDFVRLLIIEIGIPAVPATSPETFLDNEVSMQEIYSEWKETAARLVSPSIGTGVPPAIRIVGGDPTSDIENLGVTYFVQNGWRLKPAEGNHRWVVEGNVFTDPPGQSVFAFADGNFQVNCEIKFTNLIDGLRVIADNVADIRGQVERCIFLDTTAVENGNGYQQTPWNNWSDCIDDAETQNLRHIVMLGDAIVDRQLKNFVITGIGEPDLDANNQIVQGCEFRGIRLDGTFAATSDNLAFNCTLKNNVSGVEGKFLNCGLLGVVNLSAANTTTMIDCYSEIGGLNRPTINLGGGGCDVSVRGQKGGLNIGGADNAADAVTISMAMGKLTLLATNVDGVISVRGMSQFTDNSLGATVDIAGLLEPDDVRTSRKLLQNRTHTDPTTGIMVVYDDDDSAILLQADLFEDVAATQPYRGQGADRRDRLI